MKMITLDREQEIEEIYKDVFRCGTKIIGYRIRKMLPRKEYKKSRRYIGGGWAEEYNTHYSFLKTYLK